MDDKRPVEAPVQPPEYTSSGPQPNVQSQGYWGQGYQPPSHPPPMQQQNVPMQQQMPQVMSPQPVYQVVHINARGPVRMFCPYCRQEVVTMVGKAPGASAGCASLLLCLICWPCFLLPCLIPSCMDEVHVCPRCNRTLGVAPA